MDYFYKIAVFSSFLRFVMAGLFAVLLFPLHLTAQNFIPLDNTCFRTNLPSDGVGDWDDPAIWEQYNGTAWLPAAVYPNRDSRVFIDYRNEVRLTKNEEVNSLYLFAETIGEINPGPKLNLQANELWVYGQLHSISADTGDFIYHNLTSLISDWIYPEMGSIVFKGKSRTVVDRNSWSASNTNSRFAVVFDPDPGDTLVVNAAMKANSFMIRKGTVRQTLNQELTPFYTSTFSFNTQAQFGNDDYGEFRILSGATLISEGSNPFHQIIRRTDSKPASAFVLEEGANLVLLGEVPVIDAVSVQLEGSVTYAGESGSQTFLESSMATAAQEFIYTHLFFTGAAEKILSPVLKVSGDMQFLDGGIVNGASTRLVPIGTDEQLIAIPSLTLNIVEMDKLTGNIILQNDLSILRAFYMLSGTIDFSGNSLILDFDPSGEYNYSGGDWLDVDEVVYNSLPQFLDQNNALFPFYDSQLEFQRHLFLEGTIEAGTSIKIRHFENPGVTYNPGFSDTDGSAIVYQLNSYFEITGAGSAPSGIDIWVLADDLGIEDTEHLRLTGDGEAAAGNHLQASELYGRIWAGRQVLLNQLTSNAFAIASINELSVLPLEWEEFDALFRGDRVQLSWVNGTISPVEYTVFRAENQAMEFVPIGNFSGEDFDQEVIFEDQSLPANQYFWYYQVRAVDADGEQSYSPVLRVDNPLSNQAKTGVYPNPYAGGEVHIIISTGQANRPVVCKVWNSGGRLFLEADFHGEEGKIQLEGRLKALPPGSYFILIQSEDRFDRLRWLKIH
jgi:hypothetical protein